MAIEVTRDEADKKREYDRVIARMRKSDTSELILPDPNKRYRWVNTRDRSRARAMQAGFTPVPASGDTQATYGAHKDGQITMGPGSDVILMHEDMALYEEKSRVMREDNERRMALEQARSKEALNKLARDGRLVGPHQDAVVDQSEQGQTVTVRDQPTRRR